ncbi:uracil-DNA glycosylase [Robertkochia marina]|uniref:Uracil-DNA glycosylase n=1 Tax=Robertkochia marina TaxID=1227945 RepID=A0A4S3M330_9FLAO|nr:uracil-DNA glycosylase [Robertkochia marina]THD67905.1 uracil-DNA glycosylase [Robertkochia marina]TRZ41012.1 uracil-DNA glycosylase [Robertkochia marina]
MLKNLPEAWSPYLKDQVESDYFNRLQDYVKREYELYQCYPPKDQIFRALSLCDPGSVKVVIIGQDPYHGQGQANGLCFSVNPGVPHPPSLANIFKEMQQDLGKAVPESGDLSHWARQGVLLLNATLTVRESEAGSHQGQGWEQFTDRVIGTVSGNFSDIVFMLWGGYAKKKEKLINTKNHHVLKSGHPSPLSANRGYWFGNQHFSSCNQILKKLGKEPIDW